ncbi:MAG: hypothetical protein IKS55_10535 [Oscillospiraceae bacterium]|nr:hypothetical protein [Oscillospiraceae bacterium]
MKKLLSVLLMVVMLVSLSAAAFAASSPSQDTGGGAPQKEPAVKAVEIVAKDDIEFDKDCDATTGLEGLDKADEKTQEAVKDLEEKKDDATKALTPENLTKAFSGIPGLLNRADGKTCVCTTPDEIWCMNGEYPCFVKYTVDHHVDTVMLCYDGGTWEVPADLEIVDNEDGSCTISFTLYGPALYTNISFK